jgi:hypothetical protein
VAAVSGAKCTEKGMTGGRVVHNTKTECVHNEQIILEETQFECNFVTILLIISTSKAVPLHAMMEV